MNTLLTEAKHMLHYDEIIISSIKCSLETFQYRGAARPGVLILTNQKLFFYGPNMLGKAMFEEYSYHEISTIKEQKNLFGTKISILYGTEWVKFKYIQSSNPEAFVEKVREKILLSK
ncbi:hypothetical protein BAMA_05195 [Bacillus manliponensis]|uniref:YokE-like PH domain-containing protein n=1 Tax=Bacillus manliponensis TaxID=574376 RepID=A0A073JW55_9BACI|nr:PH domain-containing protein [Bacillus manliponensis]KEK18422.1 hypothetical protein BAMA_05195 [Bacillus manliponensis]